jgi:PAS domain S-box-containing protein
MPHTASHKNETSKHFEALFEYAAMGIIIADNSGKIGAMNPRAGEEFGYTEKELIGKKIEVLIPLRFHDRYLFYRHTSIRNLQYQTMGAGVELFALKKDGTEFPVEISFGHYHHNDEQFVIVFLNNVTARKKTQVEIDKLNAELEVTVKERTRDLNKTLNELQVTNEKLEDVLSFQKALLDNAGVMIIATDETGVIKLFNPEAATSIGYSESDVINKHTPVLFHHKGEIAKRRIELLNKFGITVQDDFDVLVEKSTRNIHEEEEYTYIRKDGTSFPVSLTITAIRDSNSEITGFMGIGVDISERKKVEEDLHRALKKEKELSELKSRFVSMASHEFRTPLSTVLSSAYLIEKYPMVDDQPKREKHLQRIISSVSMLTDILNDFLSVGKIEEGKIQVRLTVFNIHDLIKQTIDEIRNTLKKQQKIHYSHTGGTDTLLDASLLKHIIMNLVSNAGKFSPDTGLIEIRSDCHGHQATISVKDYGIGISKEDQKHLMERFFRGANAANIQGTGLGLHIVSKYAELMNGKVEWKSELEKGTEFLITFNLKADGYEKDLTNRR